MCRHLQLGVMRNAGAFASLIYGDVHGRHCETLTDALRFQTQLIDRWKLYFVSETHTENLQKSAK